MPLYWLPFRLRLIMVSPSFVTCDDSGQKGLRLTIKTLQQFRTDGFPLTFVLGCETPRNPSCAYLRIFQSLNNCLCTSIADWKLYGQLPTCDAPIRMNNVIGAPQHVWTDGCGRTPRPRLIMQLRFSTSWCLNSLTQRPTVLLSTAQLPYTAHNRLWMFPTLSPPLRIQLHLVVCNVCQTQTPFSQTTTAALSIGRPCTYTHLRNKHQCCCLSIFTLLSLFWNEKKNVGHYFLSNLRSSVERHLVHSEYSFRYCQRHIKGCKTNVEEEFWKFIWDTGLKPLLYATAFLMPYKGAICDQQHLTGSVLMLCRADHSQWSYSVVYMWQRP